MPEKDAKQFVEDAIAYGQEFGSKPRDTALLIALIALAAESVDDPTAEWEVGYQWAIGKGYLVETGHHQFAMTPAGEEAARAWAKKGFDALQEGE